MTRFVGIPAGDAGPEVIQIYELARTGMDQLTGRGPERGIGPIETHAHLPGLLRAGILPLALATTELHGVDRRLHALVSLAAAMLTNCEYRIDLTSQVSRQVGPGDEELQALPTHRTSHS